MAGDTKFPPLVIFGLDAGDADLIERWAAEGYLPAVASIMRLGCRGRITGPELVSEHGVWVSLFSGVSPGQHGYYYWRPLKPGTYELRLTDLRDVGALPFWSCLQGRGKKALIIDAPETYPVTGLPGVQLANWAPHNPRFATCTQPVELLQDLRRRFGPQTWAEEEVGSKLDQDRKIYYGLLEQIERKGALCRYLLTQDRFDLVVIGFFEPHVAGHQFWKYHSQIPVAGAAAAELRYAIRDIYQAIDRQMGLLLAQLPRESNAFLVANVGMQEDYPSGKLTEAFCRHLGYQIPVESALRPLRLLDFARRVIPAAWRIALSRRLPRKTRERLLVDQFRNGTDWRKTTAFALPSFYTGFLRVNLRGREPQGVVEPGAGYEALLDRLEADLRQLIDPVTNQPAVRQVARTVELFGGGPPVSLPDLFFEWTPTSYLKRRVIHPRAVLTQENLDFSRGTHHTHHGFVAAAGPSIQQGALGAIQVLDLSPTFLFLLGEPVPQRMTGQVIKALVHG